MESNRISRMAGPGPTGDPEIDETWDLLAGLRPEQRLVLVLRYYEDLSHPGDRPDRGLAGGDRAHARVARAASTTQGDRTMTTTTRDEVERRLRSTFQRQGRPAGGPPRTRARRGSRLREPGGRARRCRSSHGGGVAARFAIAAVAALVVVAAIGAVMQTDVLGGSSGRGQVHTRPDRFHGRRDAAAPGAAVHSGRHAAVVVEHRGVRPEPHCEQPALRCARRVGRARAGAPDRDAGRVARIRCGWSARTRPCGVTVCGGSGQGWRCRNPGALLDRRRRDHPRHDAWRDRGAGGIEILDALRPRSQSMLAGFDPASAPVGIGQLGEAPRTRRTS